MFMIKDRWRVVASIAIPDDVYVEAEAVCSLDTHVIPRLGKMRITSDLSDIILGSSAHVDFVRNFDWSSTPLGPVTN